MSHAANGEYPTVASYIAIYGHSCAVAVHVYEVATAENYICIPCNNYYHNFYDQSFTIISNI